jgi:GNAT superfamily N-acetyltransferase
MIEIQTVKSSSDRRRFLKLPATIYRDYPAWVPPLRSDLAKQIDPATGPYFKHSQGEFFLATREGEVVGRIAAFRNQRHLDAHADGVGFWGFFESIDDQAVADALLDEAMRWLRQQGLRVARGPANFDIYQEAGVVVDGHEFAPMVGMAYTPPYYGELIERAGFTKAKDLLVLRIDRSTVDRSRVSRLRKLVERSREVVVRSLRMDDLKAESECLAAVYGEAWRENWGQVPLPAEEFYNAYHQYRLFIVPDLCLLAEVDGVPVGYSITMPDMNVLLRKLKGRLTPVGLWHVLFGRRRISRYRVMMGGVRPGFRRAGVALKCLVDTWDRLEARGATEVEFSWLLEENLESLTICRSFGARTVQTLRLYDRAVPEEATG